VRGDAGEPIINQHEAGDENDRPHGRLHAAVNRVFAERRIDVAGINDVQRRFERILQDVRDAHRFLDRVIAGDLAVAGFNRALDVRRGFQLAVQNDRQTVADIFARGLAEFFRAVIGQCEINLRLAQIAAHDHRVFDDVAREAILRFAADDDLFQRGLAIGLLFDALEQLVTRRNRFAVADDFVAVVIDHAKFEIGLLLNLFLRIFLVRLREAGQLDQDPVAAGGLNDRFGHAETVDAFAQDIHGLRHCGAGHVRARLLRAIGAGLKQDVRIHLQKEGSAAL